MSAPEFADPTLRDAFFVTYRRMLDRWPVPAHGIDLDSEFGRTHVHVAGPADGPPLILMHGHGTTSAAWFDAVGPLAREHRVYAVDRIGDAGYSVHDGAGIRTGDDLVRWLAGVLDRLGLDRVRLCGHSTGGWLALAFAIAHPERVQALCLLDPTRCVSGFRAGYLLRALPMLLRPTVSNTASFLGWETAPCGLDPGA